MVSENGGFLLNGGVDSPSPVHVKEKGRQIGMEEFLARLVTYMETKAFKEAKAAVIQVRSRPPCKFRHALMPSTSRFLLPVVSRMGVVWSLLWRMGRQALPWVRAFC